MTVAKQASSGVGPGRKTEGGRPCRGALLTSDPLAREESFGLARLARADAAFLTSSISGRHPARLQNGVARYDRAGLEVRS